MGSFSIWHWLIVLVIVLLLFGAGKLPNVMGDIAKGVKAFKAGLKDEDEAQPPAATTAQAPPAAINPAPAQPAHPQPTTPQPTATTTAQPVDPTRPHQG
ncbi:sec-independent protein translocase protein TatA [Azospirillum lipoferum]|uniref:Sec-independent protein translocase protein TatA n=1 Tax=Azospirillum lipoferum TaxID=193 RepID=A0A5A9GX97_AZOLI|nr:MULTISPECIES: twin-arginine translocase TatA/TatE family subunit [Azospirillum]KAA0598194.1 twin-arginine translocase TatA/TatE family subunit [Azospirillum lipoferum]MCP1609827.1 sec-independent protein translocase protein TatA [Azospirillum lipoferum]MDW5534869.1 twin-arginine translocase TatA/TatE family subunit [Azospirillum sp. NL1]